MLRSVGDPKWNKYGRNHLASRSEVARLIVEKDVGLQDVKYKLFLNSAEEKSVVRHDAPAF